MTYINGIIIDRLGFFIFPVLGRDKGKVPADKEEGNGQKDGRPNNGTEQKGDPHEGNVEKSKKEGSAQTGSENVIPGDPYIGIEFIHESEGIFVGD